jgi:6-phosphogluconate dehydrogenase (decarboxylating)
MNTTVVDANEGHWCMLESYSNQVVNSVICQGLLVRTTIKLCRMINPTVVLNIHFS